MARTIRAAWDTWAGDGHEELTLEIAPERVVARSRLGLEIHGGGFEARYRIEADRSWRTRSLEVEIVGTPRRLTITGDGHGRWTDAHGQAVADLAGAVDVDLSATPFTNTLPIRRLNLAAGEPRDIEVAYVEAPTLALSRQVQRYTRLGADRFRFESDGGRFSRDLVVDPDGLVEDYPGLFRRVDPR